MLTKRFILAMVVISVLLPVIVPAQNDKPKSKFLDGELVEEGQPSPAAPPQPPPENRSSQVVTLLKEFSVTLPANQSTGYTWRVATYDRNYLQLLRRRYQKPADLRPGAGGQEVFDFLPLRSGTTVIVFHYQRPFEPQVARDLHHTVVIN